MQQHFLRHDSFHSFFSRGLPSASAYGTPNLHIANNANTKILYKADPTTLSRIWMQAIRPMLHTSDQCQCLSFDITHNQGNEGTLVLGMKFSLPLLDKAYSIREWSVLACRTPVEDLFMLHHKPLYLQSSFLKQIPQFFHLSNASPMLFLQALGDQYTYFWFILPIECNLCDTNTSIHPR